MSAALKAAGGGVVREQPRLRKSLVVVQVALSFLMLATAGLFVRSLDNLLRVHPGFATAQVTSFTVDLERSGYEDARSQQFARALLERLERCRASTPRVSPCSASWRAAAGGCASPSRASRRSRARGPAPW